MTRTTDHRGLHRFAVLTGVSALALICAGGLVTSHGAGMSVPDWPTTYGDHMFFFPVSKWVGGVLYEHTHRLLASAVGLLTVVLAVWLWLREQRAWLRWLGLGAVALVVLQGVLGGLRVVQFKDELGIFHAALAQLFLVLLSAIALFTSRSWIEKAGGLPMTGLGGTRCLYALATCLIFAQLVLGATMRHQHAGLAIPDFPTAYGKLWPAMDAASVARYNQARSEVTALNPIASLQVALQMFHRVVALGILGLVTAAAWRTRLRLGWAAGLTKLSMVWLALILLQVLLGAATIWTNKAPNVATAHVAVGALSLVAGAMLVMKAWRLAVLVRPPRRVCEISVRGVEPTQQASLTA